MLTTLQNCGLEKKLSRLAHYQEIFGALPKSATNLMRNYKEERKTILGIDPGTVQNKLRKQLLFKYVKLANDNICFQCNKEIETIEELSIEHKIPWLKNGKEYFWDLNNITFSHLRCNILAAERKRGITHPSQESYKQGCRCDKCIEIQKLRIREYRAKLKLNK